MRRELLSSWFLLLPVLLVVRADVSEIVIPDGSCLTVTATSVNVRNAACGATILGSATLGQNYGFSGGRTRCTMNSVQYHFTEIDFNGQSGWMAGDYLDITNLRSCSAARFPDPEFRAVWIATVYNIDWPTSSSLSPAAQQQEMTDYVNMMDDVNLNAMVFQVRTSGDAMYDSPLEPWSRYLTGTQGTAPSPLYDPLTFAIQEAHAKGFEVHAWLNPYRANLSPSCVTGLASNHMAIRWPQHAKVYGNNCWMDPGAQVIIDHLLNVVNDIISRYDVDGIHFDDYFYPYPTSDPFPDDDTYNAYLGQGGTMNRPDWRRDNVNRMIQSVYELINTNKPSVAFSISPFGIYRPGNSEGMPPPIAGLDPYTTLYADSKLWLQQGWLDIMAPQQYWQIHPPAQSYTTLMDWWVNANTLNRHVYAGIGMYRLSAGDGDWPISEYENQVDVSRLYYDDGSLGHIHYSAKFFRDNTKNIRDHMSQYCYPNRVSLPSLPWKGIAAAEKPDRIRADGFSISWEQDSAVKFWAVYRHEAGEEWRLINVQDKHNTNVNVVPGVYAVRALNGANEESEPAIVYVMDPVAIG